MFTGLVSGVGTLVARDGARFGVASPFKRKSLEEGASIACDGCCLTLIGVSKGKAGAVFTVEASNETLARTTLGDWREGRRVNLERSLTFGEALGGHLVSGHIDGRARIFSCAQDGDSVRFVLEAPDDVARFIAPKGAVALNGVSLTVNDVEDGRFGVNIIPYTLSHTTWGDLGPGDLVNLEVDILARYVARLTQHEGRIP
ncbi:MAG: riboflavin synthase [Methyloceanibacter sp.]